jgi:phage terminase large subunit
MKTTHLFSRIVEAYSTGVRRIVNKGGTSSSKTISTLQLLHIIAERHQGTTISVVSETMPHLKKGAMRDYDNILKAIGKYDERNINQTNHQYKVGTSTIEFFSADTVGKATGPRRNILYLNECNNIPYKVVAELEQRTDKVIFYDYNPVAPFWIEDTVFRMPSNEYALLKSNYTDNDFLPETIRKEIEMRANRDPNYKRVHIDCEYGVYEGLIFPDITLVDDKDFPKLSTNGYGMDFGFTNDPTTLTEVAIQGDNLYCDELLYQTAMTTPDIIRFLKGANVGRKEIVADSSDPRIIEEIKRAGFNCHGAVKGPGSIQHGIDSMKRYNIHVTKRSVNMIKELRNYKWKEDSSGNMMNEPVDFWNHCIDGARYRVAKVTSKPKTFAPRVNY